MSEAGQVYDIRRRLVEARRLVRAGDPLGARTVLRDAVQRAQNGGDYVLSLALLPILTV
jgi:fermentation-respiration switch protein FrsA (DUF1100 family)